MIEVSVPGIYISYPFCSQKCTYCNFASGVFPRAVERSYVDALVREIAEFASACTLDTVPDTVYLGGGTPSSMDAEDLARVLRAVPGKTWKEATIETAPGTLTRELVDAWAAMGINRVSLGVQSFVSEELRRTGRKHTAEIVAGDVALLRAGGIDNFNIDLIAGLPRQTAASWGESLDWLERLGAPHVSVYMLEVDEDSRLGAEILLNGQRYGANETPGDDAAAEMYQAAVERLARLGIARYEISNFARPGWESLHNLKYWQLAPYIGFGADAHSFDGLLRWQNPETIENYLARGEREYTAAAGDEKFFVGLRLMRGVVPEEAEWRHYGEAIGRFVDRGLLERAGDAVRLTARGVMVSNDVLMEFLNA
jgi:oxygen-independent coproporphyrinogen III oxidase